MIKVRIAINLIGLGVLAYNGYQIASVLAFAGAASWALFVILLSLIVAIDIVTDTSRLARLIWRGAE